MLKEIPQIIDSLNTSRLWDLTLFQLESDTHTFGIPGETWCFECDTNFQVSNLIILFYLHPKATTIAIKTVLLNRTYKTLFFILAGMRQTTAHNSCTRRNCYRRHQYQVTTFGFYNSILSNVSTRIIKRICVSLLMIFSTKTFQHFGKCSKMS